MSGRTERDQAKHAFTQLTNPPSMPCALPVSTYYLPLTYSHSEVMGRHVCVHFVDKSNEGIFYPFIYHSTNDAEYYI